MKRWSFRACAAAITLAAWGPADAEGLSLPYAPQAPGGQDAIETAGGARCRQSMNGNGAYLDLGVGRVANSLGRDAYDEQETSVIGYARVVIPLGRKPERLDCKRLYDLEVERLKMEIELLRMGG